MGDWIEIERSWRDTSVDHCGVCGRLITRRAWRFDGVTGHVLACSPDCEELYESYLVPTHGKVDEA